MTYYIVVYKENGDIDTIRSTSDYQKHLKDIQLFQKWNEIFVTHIEL